MTYFSQMVALAIHNFMSAAVALALPRFWCEVSHAIQRRPSVTSGSISPASLIPASADLRRLRDLLVSQGMIQNFKPLIPRA